MQLPPHHDEPGKGVSEQAAHVLLTEYSQIKAEQMARIAHRDNLLYAVLGSMAAIVAVTATLKAPVLLLVVPLACVILGWTHLSNDHMVTAIGRYVREDLEPRLAALVISDTDPLFGWERHRSGDHRRRSRKVIQLAVDLTAFVLPPLAAIATAWTMGPRWPIAIIAGLIELAMVVVLAAQMVTYADLGQR